MSVQCAKPWFGFFGHRNGKPAHSHVFGLSHHRCAPWWPSLESKTWRFTPSRLFTGQNCEASSGKHLLLLEKVLLGRSISSHQNAIAPLGSTFLFKAIKIHWGPSAVHDQQGRGLAKDTCPGALRGQRGQMVSAFCRIGEGALCN